MIQTYVCVDLETTGLNPKTDKIIEIGAVKVVEGEIVDRFSSFVNPGRKLEERIVELTGITDEDLADAPPIEEVLPQILEFAGDAILLGHSVLFDFSFLKKAAVNQKCTFEKEAIDTLKISRKYLADLESRSLDYLCGHFAIPHNAHRALADAEATHILYGKLLDRFYSAEEDLFRPHKLIYKAKKDSPATNSQKERLYRLTSQHNITLGVDVEMLTKSEASRIIDKLRVQFSGANVFDPNKNIRL